MKVSLKVREPWNGWDGRVLKGHRTMECMEWEGPLRSQKHGMVGVAGSIKVTVPWNGWGGRVLKGHRTMEFLG